MIDAHIHVVDFLQDAADPVDLLAAFDACGVEAGVVFGLPVKKKWGQHEPSRPHYYLDDTDHCYPWSATDEATLRFVERCAEPERLAPLLCGVDPTDLDSARRVDELLSDGRFAGVGELLLRHGRLTPLIHGEQARANHPATIAIAEVCARHGVPLVAHQNSGSTGQGPTAYVPELSELLTTVPDVDLVWSHGGCTEEHVAPPPELLDHLLTAHPRLHIDISWAATEIVSAHNHVAHQWAETIARHPDRFLWGSDSVGRFDTIPRVAASITSFLEQLTPAARRAVSTENARRLFFDGRSTSA